VHFGELLVTGQFGDYEG